MPARLSRARSALLVGLVAAAVDLEPGRLVAVPEIDPATGNGMIYRVEAGEVAPIVFGVGNVGGQPVDGVVVQFRLYRHVELAARYDNCWYETAPEPHSVWCGFDDELGPA